MKNELKTQCTIVIAKMCLFFLVYFLLVVYGGIFIYAASHFFVNYCMPHIQDSYETENYENLIIFIIITIVGCGFLLLYGLYPLKFIFGKSGKTGDSRIETTKEENPRLFKLIKEVADATGNKMPKHVFLSQEINACVFYDNTLRSLLFPTRKNLMIGLGLCANTNTEEIKSIIAHEFGHFAQNTMQIGSIIYFLNSVIYDMAFQYDKWDYLLAKYFKILTGFFKMLPYCGIIICLLLYLLYSILDLTKKVLRWTYKFVNKSYYSLSRQMEFDADEVACNFVGKENFISALIKIEFCSTCNSNATTAWKRLIEEGKYAQFFDVLELFEKYKAQEQEVAFSYNTVMNNTDDLEEYHSEISYINLYSDHPSTAERIKAVEKKQSSEQKKLLPAWYLFEHVTIEKLEKLYITSIDGIKSNDLQFIKGEELTDWIKQDFEGACLPKKYRPFFEEIITFDINDIKLEEYESYPFSEENRDLIKKLVGARNDRNTMLDLNNQDDIKYAIYKGVRYEVKEMPLNEQMKHVKELTIACQCISIEVFAYLSSIKPNVISSQMVTK